MTVIMEQRQGDKNSGTNSDVKWELYIAQMLLIFYESELYKRFPINLSQININQKLQHPSSNHPVLQPPSD